MGRTIRPSRNHSRASVRAHIRKIVSDLWREPYHPDVIRLKKRIAQEILRIVESEFLKKSQGLADDAGVLWEHTRDFRERGRPMLLKTLNLLKSFSYRLTNDGIVIFVEPSAPYAGYLHRGTRRMPPRPFWPEDFPESWVARALRLASDEILRYIEGRLQREL